LKARTDGADNFPTVLVDPAAADQVGAELQFGERVLWSGRPDSRSWFVSSDLYLVPFSLLWGAFAIFWEASAVTSHGGLFFDVWGVPFVAIGLYMIAGRFIVRRRLMRRTAYAITEQRAIAIRPTWRGGRETTSVWFASSPPISQRAVHNGHGTVIVGTSPASRQLSMIAGDPGWPFSMAGASSCVALWNISDANEVAKIATRLIIEAKT
jgi:hypothetical protein